MKPRLESSTIPKAIREAVLERDDHACVRCGVAIQRPYYSLQHRDPRGAGGSRLLHTMANLVTLCGSGTTRCHGHVESYRDESKAHGWLVPNGAVPEEWPVRRWTPDGPRWMQPGNEWAEAVPHEWQREMGAAA
ncbi:MAG: HNH endonuclease signature motif containing protein [Actinophytocola sp.]|uniref:HNH endonuclease n=1 Tax=Actinophytocola sp. TaxID=1872138 RepID=UPI003C727D74